MNTRKKSAAVACLGTVSFRRYIRWARRQTRHFIIWQCNVSFGGNCLFKTGCVTTAYVGMIDPFFLCSRKKETGNPDRLFFFVNAKPVYSTIWPSLHRPVEKGRGRCKFRLPGILLKNKRKNNFDFFAILFYFSKYPFRGQKPALRGKVSFTGASHFACLLIGDSNLNEATFILLAFALFVILEINFLRKQA